MIIKVGALMLFGEILTYSGISWVAGNRSNPDVSYRGVCIRKNSLRCAFKMCML